MNSGKRVLPNQNPLTFSKIHYASVGLSTQHAIDVDLKESLVSQQSTLEQSLNVIFPTHPEENSLQKAKRVLGSDVENITDEALSSYITEFQHLLELWLDDYERSVFQDRTLRQIWQKE